MKYVIKEWHDVIWIPLVLPKISFRIFWPMYWYIKDHKRVRAWRRPYWLYVRHPYATNSIRDATKVTYLQALIYYVVLKLWHRRWRRHTIKIHRHKKMWYEKT